MEVFVGKCVNNSATRKPWKRNKNSEVCVLVLSRKQNQDTIQKQGQNLSQLRKNVFFASRNQQRTNKTRRTKNQRKAKKMVFVQNLF